MTFVRTRNNNPVWKARMLRQSMYFYDRTHPEHLTFKRLKLAELRFHSHHVKFGKYNQEKEFFTDFS